MEDVDSQVQQFFVFKGTIREGHVDIPWRISHYHVEFTQNLEIEISDIAVYPLSVQHSLSDNRLFLSNFSLLVFLDIVDQFAVRVVAGVEVGTVAKAFISFLIDDRAEVFLCAKGMPLGFLTLIPRAMITVLQILL